MKKIFLGILAIIMSAVMVTTPVLAAKCTCNKKGDAEEIRTGIVTSVLGEPGTDESGNAVNCSCDDGNGSEVTRLLQLVVEIMTIGIGILAVTGITIVGLQYLTAGGSEEKTRKAKRRMLEIVIGIVAYVVLFAALKFLVPDFHPFGA